MIHQVSGDILLTHRKAMAHGVSPSDPLTQGLGQAPHERRPAMHRDYVYAEFHEGQAAREPGLEDFEPTRHGSGAARRRRSRRPRGLAAGMVISVLVASLGIGIGATAQAVPATSIAPTFSEHVAPILYAKCVVCHRPGQAGPMSLATFRDVQPFAASIRERLLERRMPPWHTDAKYGTFPNNPRLSQAEIDTVVRWVEAGAPEGDPARLPPLPPLPSRR